MDLTQLKATHLVFLAAVLAVLARWAARRVAEARFQRRTGSRPAPHLKPSAGFLGLGWMRENFEAAKTGQILNLFTERLRQSGQTYKVVVLGHAFHFTADVDNIRAAVNNMADWGVAARATSAGWAPFAQRGIFVSDGHEWEASRALVRPAVARGEISQLDKLEVHVADLIRRLEAAGGATVDLQRLFLDTTFDSALDFLLGVGTTGSLTAREAADKTAFGEALDRCTETIFYRMRTPPEWRWTMVRRNRQNKRDTATVHRFIDMMVARQAEKLAADKGGGPGGEPDDRRPYIFADELLRVSGGDAEQVKWELLSLLAAARDTTALLISNVFHALARHPAVWARLRDEVDGLQGRKPDYETLKSMRYLKYVLNESECLFPSPCRASPADTPPGSAPRLPRRRQQRPVGQQGHDAPARRRARRTGAVLRAQGNVPAHGVPRGAPAGGRIRGRRRGVPARALGRPGSAAGLELPALLGRPPGVPRPAVRTCRGRLHRRAPAAGLSAHREPRPPALRAQDPHQRQQPARGVGGAVEGVRGRGWLASEPGEGPESVDVW